MELEVVIKWLAVLEQKHDGTVSLLLFADGSWCVLHATNEDETVLFGNNNLQELEKLINDNKRNV